MYLRIDRDLAAFFTYLDKQVGKGQYTVFLTADHAGSNNINFQQDHGLTAIGFDIPAAEKLLRDSLQANFGASDLIRGISNIQVQLNEPAIQRRGINQEVVIASIVKWLSTFPAVAYAVDQTKVEQASIPNVIKEKIRNGYHPYRSGEIQIVLEPGSYEAWGKGPYRGTTHGTWTPPDTHIPLLFMGWGINPVKHLYREVSMTDIAPTIAALLKIQMPNGCIGKPISEVLATHRR
jgi:arylsulfatase A-like enzyme